MNRSIARHCCSPQSIHSRRAAGFTLMEVLLVLVILVVLSAIAVPTYHGILDISKKRAAQVQVHLIDQAVEVYKLNSTQLPGGLIDLVHCPADPKMARNWAGPYLKQSSALTDPWEDPYQYDAQGTRNVGSYDIWSYGPDTQDGTADDIGNWGG